MAALRQFAGTEGLDFFEHDRGFQALLRELAPPADREGLFSGLRRCAAQIAGGWDALAAEASLPENLPRLIKHDRVANPVERVELGPHTRRLRREAASLGILDPARSELYRFAHVYLLGHMGEASLMCAISCTDGLIRALEACGSESLRRAHVSRLRSADTPFAGAQFITDQAGGSDIGAIETLAVPGPDGGWSIRGEKWFCSNPDEYFLVAARPEGAAEGTRGVAVFLVPRLRENGTPNGVSFRRLKDKLGTRSLPTAEIDFQDATGHLIGEADGGFKTLMRYVINTSRVHNAANCCAFLHRAFLEARNYARQRTAFGAPIIAYPLLQQTLLGLLERLWRNRLLTFRLVSLIDRHGIAPEDPEQEVWQRFLLNLAKYRTASNLGGSIREAILVLGGNGIVEDFSILPRLLRDALILETWEGTPHTLCMQILRDAKRSTLLERWHREIERSLQAWPGDFLSHTRNRVERVFAGVSLAQLRKQADDPRWGLVHAARLGVPTSTQSAATTMRVPDAIRARADAGLEVVRTRNRAAMAAIPGR